MCRAPRPAPKRYSPQAAQLASLSSSTGISKRASRVSHSGLKSQLGKLLLVSTTPHSQFTCPAQPTPAPATWSLRMLAEAEHGSRRLDYGFDHLIRWAAGMRARNAARQDIALPVKQACSDLCAANINPDHQVFHTILQGLAGIILADLPPSLPGPYPLPPVSR